MDFPTLCEVTFPVQDLHTALQPVSQVVPREGTAKVRVNQLLADQLQLFPSYAESILDHSETRGRLSARQSFPGARAASPAQQRDRDQ